MTKKQQNISNRPMAWFLWGALALSLLWCLLGGFYLLDGDMKPANALQRIAAPDNPLLALLAFALPLLLFWSVVLLGVCLAELRAGRKLLSEITARHSRPDTEAQRREELQLQERLLQARQESSVLTRSLIEEWRKLSSLLEGFHEQGRLLRENGEEMEGILREAASALPGILARNLAQLENHLDDSREQIGILIRARAEQEATLSRGLAAMLAEIPAAADERMRHPQDSAREGEIPRWISAIQSLDVMARLRAMTPDIDTALRKSPSPSLWRRHRQGERGLFTPQDYTSQGLDLYLQIVRACEQDEAFRGRVDTYIDRFETLLENLQPQDQDTCLDSQAGKIHLLLAQARGRFS